MARSINRRDFVKGSAAAGIGYWVAGRGAWALGKAPDVLPTTERLNVAFVGTAGRAGGDLHETAGTGLVNVVALCDVDQKLLGKASKEFAGPKTYSDWRKMFEQKDIDAVVIGTPDHTHAVAAAAALRLGKHVYCEKPLTHTVHEARVVTELAAKYKRCTQMGTQIHAGANYRRVVEIIKAGVIGPVKEVHVWCSAQYTAPGLPVGEPVPENLDYDLWVGPAPFHPFSSKYVPFNWRRYWAYGDGSLGDMACHFTDLPFWALDLLHPTRVSIEAPPVVDRYVCPDALTVHYEFPARGELPPVKLTWYDGGRKPAQFKEWGINPKWGSGVMFVGSKGQLFSDYGMHHLYPEKDFADFTPPSHTIPNSIGHHKEWVTACMKNDWEGTTCRFAYSGALTRRFCSATSPSAAGTALEWDAKNFKITNSPAAEQYLHYEYRKGWEL